MAEPDRGLSGSIRLEVRALACQRGERLLFSDLDVTLRAGQALVVSGENGSGKTTLLRTLAGFIAPAAGTITLDGLVEDTPPAEAMHYLGHRDGLRAALTARENLDIARAMLGVQGLTSAAALERLGLAHVLDLPVAVLSAGQRRRVALARLLVAERPLWLLDEPTSALDLASQGLVASLIGAHCRADGIVIAATHLDLGIAAERITLGGAP